MRLATVLELLEGVVGTGEDSQWKALCPAHDDRNPSLSVGYGSKHRTLLSCHAGCGYSAVVGALKDRLVQQGPIEYRYVGEGGEWVGSSVKTYNANGEKRFYQKSPNGNKSSPALKVTPYMLPDLLKGIDRGEIVLVVEGEKDCETLVRMGKTATCNVGGAGKWRDEHSGWLSGANKVFVIADNDAPGLKHAENVRESVRRVCPEVKVAVFTPKLGKDISEHLVLGGKLSELDRVRDSGEEVNSGLEPDELEGWRIRSAADFIFRTPTEVPAVWGKDGDRVLWAAGQGLVIAAPQGIGKTTLATLLLEARLGLVSDVLGYPVKPSERSTLYMAMDRPQQIALAMRRVFAKHGEERVSNRRGVIHEGPPPQDLGRHPEALLELCDAVGADTVFVDSLKDAVLGLTNEEGAQGWNRAVQLCLAEGINVCILHHVVKSAGRDEKPVDLADFQGSNWLTAGMGSALLLWGKSESRYLELSQLKSPVKAVDSLRLHRRAKDGVFELMGNAADLDWFFCDPHTISEAASYMFPGENSKANYDKARRMVEDKLTQGKYERHSETKPEEGRGGRPSIRYILRDMSQG